MFGSIQPNAYAQGYLSMIILYLTKNEMLDPLNGTTATGGQFVMNLPYVDNGLDLITRTTPSTSTPTSGWSGARRPAFKPW